MPVVGAAVCSATLPAGTLPSVAGPVVWALAPPANATASAAAAKADFPGRHRRTLLKTERMAFLLAGGGRRPALRLFVAGWMPWTAPLEGRGGRRFAPP